MIVNYSKPNSKAVNHRQRGLTLIELLVVLLVLAVLAGAAFEATTGTVDQSRYQATRQMLESVESAVLGPENLRDDAGAAVVTGFVADVGRLPHAIELEVGEPLMMAELWQKPDAMQTYAIRSPAGDQQVRLGTGWRGPYLRLGVGGRELQDGWGSRPRLLDTQDSGSDADITAANQPVHVVRSYGADQLDGTSVTDVYSEDLSVVLGQEAENDPTPRHLGHVQGNVSFFDTSDPPEPTTPQDNSVMIIRLYGPSPLGNGLLVTLAQFTAIYDSTDVETWTTVLDESGNEQTTSPDPLNPQTATDQIDFEFQGITIGPRVLRAYFFDNQTQTTPPDLEESLEDWASDWDAADKRTRHVTVTNQNDATRDIRFYDLN